MTYSRSDAEAIAASIVVETRPELVALDADQLGQIGHWINLDGDTVGGIYAKPGITAEQMEGFVAWARALFVRLFEHGSYDLDGWLAMDSCDGWTLTAREHFMDPWLGAHNAG